MKTIIKYIGILTSVLVLQSCSDFLDLEPESGISPGNFFQSEQDARMALAGVYDILGYEQTYGAYFWYQFGLGTDVSVVNRSAVSSGVHVNNYDPGQAELGKSWEAIYDGINRANLFLENVPDIDMDEEEKSRMLGEVHFIRGLLYFNLVRLWGDVPLKTESTKSIANNQEERVAARQIYDQVLSDMEKAEQMVYPASRFSSAENGRVCQGAVQGMLARVNLTMAGYPIQDQSRFAQALAWAEKVKNSGEHQLNSDYTQVFKNLTQDVFDMQESMFEVVFYGNRDADAESWRFGGINGLDSRNVDAGFSYAFFNATKKLYDLYEDTDSRRDWNIATYRILSNGNKVYYTDTDLFNRKPGKFRRETEAVDPKNKNFTPTNFPVMRYADVLLMLAEAENEINGPTQKAVDALNEVRQRATGASVYDIADFTGKDHFRNVIIDERARELCHEGERKMDLIRWGSYVSTLKNLATSIKAEYPANRQYMARVGDNVENKHLLLPIPSVELELNPALGQNPDW